MDENSVEEARPLGRTTVAPGVLLTIARLAALDIQGVSRMAVAPSGVAWIPKRSQADGVRIEIEDDRVYADLYVIMKNNVNVREVSRSIQREVARAISEMIGMEVGRVNIHIENIDYPTETKAEA